MSKKFNKNTAKMHILGHVMNNFLTRKYEQTGDKYPGFDSFLSFVGAGKPSIGDLVALQSVRQKTKWYLSWYVGFESRGNYFSDIHVLESIEDGELCNWSNVGFMVMDREVLKKHPEWLWSDQQFGFKERWYKSIYRLRDCHITLPAGPWFDQDGYGVTLGTRTKFSLGGETKKRFVDYRKVRITDMSEYYDQAAWEDI